MFVENFTKFIKYYGKGQKVKLTGFFLLTLFVGFLEFLGISLVYPFILLILKPESVVKTKYYTVFASFIHIQDVLLSAFILGAIVILLFVFKNLFMIFSLYLQNKFINNWRLEINKQFMHYYLFSPYKNLLKTTPSEKIYNLNFLINQSLDGFIFRIINLITNIVIVAMILGLLFSKFLFAAIITCIFIFFSMSFQNKVFKKRIQKISKELLKESVDNNNRIIENIDNLKEIKILSAEKYFYNEFLNTQIKLTNIVFKNNFYGSITPYIVEIFVVLSLLILAGFISLQNIESTPWMIASYGIVVASIFRIAPALNRIQTSINSINASRDLVKKIIQEHDTLNEKYIEEKYDFDLNFKNYLKFKNVYFSYKKTPVIKNLNFEIKKGEFVGIIGLSGAGKSTLADIIMGLLPIDKGQIIIDDKEFENRDFIALRKLIGYVPQQMSVLDGSFKKNVAWGVNTEEINEQRVIEVLKQAHLYSIVEQFDQGINSPVIKGSIGLSQGQKQRLAIARALYRNPEILIFDEATSALDVETENQITQTLEVLKGEKTIIAIAHRLSTLKSCDKLIYLKDGTVVDTGTFYELSLKYKDFKNLIKLSNIDHI